MEYGNKMRCQRCVLTIEDFSGVMMDGTLLFHQHCYQEGLAELNRVYHTAPLPEVPQDLPTPTPESSAESSRSIVAG